MNRRPVQVLLSTLCLIAFALLVFGCRQSEEPHVDTPHLTPGVVLRDTHFFSSSLRRDMPYRVYLPDQIEVGKRLPVVYLLHGGGGDFRDWSNNSYVAQYALSGLILVMPDGANSYWMNAVHASQDKYEDYLTKDLIADVEAQFPAATGRQNRAVVGVSMGGFAAVKLALSHPDLYVYAGGISPAIDVPERRFSWKRVGQWWGFRRIFGALGSAERRARDPFELIGSVVPGATPYLYLTAGDNEALLGPNRRFVARLKERRFAYEFHTKPGGHDWSEWNSQIPGCFQLLMKRMLPGG